MVRNHSKTEPLGAGFEAVFEALREAGVEPPVDAVERLEAHEALVRAWNRAATLVSKGDAGRLRERHTYDSLSLAPYVQRGLERGPWLDVGTGGGFPAIPVRIVLGEAALTCVERNGRKAAFLRHAAARLGLSDVEVREEAFPDAVEGKSFGVVTARAVERPEAWLARIGGVLTEGGVFLNQTGRAAAEGGEGFHVEHIEDAFGARGWRRGALEVMGRRR